MSTVLDKVDGLEPDMVAAGMGVVRGLVGLSCMFAPGLTWRVVAGYAPEGSTAPVRMLGARELVIGAGILTADDDRELGRWITAAAISDAGDGAAHLITRVARGKGRWLSVVGGVLMAAFGLRIAQRLGK